MIPDGQHPLIPTGPTGPTGELRHATKIVATLGPASEPLLGPMIDAGLSVARLNFGHGQPEEHRRRVARLREAAERRGARVGILGDLPGPKLRLGRFEGGFAELEEGQEVSLVEGAGPARAGVVPFDFSDLLPSIRSGQRVHLADGAVELVVLGGGRDSAAARVLRGGRAGDRQGVHLPDSSLVREVPTEKDRELIELACELSLDLLGLSFVSSAEEVERVRELAPAPLLVAKIERRAALDELDGILAAADGVMVARGDLGVEVELEQLPLIQKSLIARSLEAGRFTITATEMLESMVSASRPTRAEVTDVANAVLDGSDAVMLSAETAVGAYPVQAVETMRRIAATVEASQRYRDIERIAFRRAEPTVSNATTLAAVQAAEALGIERIVCFTETGNTARLLSRYRPVAEVIALSPDERTLGRMAVLGCVRPVLFERRGSLEEMLEASQQMLVERGLCRTGEEIAFVAGVPPGVSCSTNVMKLHRIGDPARLH